MSGWKHATAIPVMGDELVSYTIGKLDSWKQIREALAGGADSQGPLFQMTNWVWLGLRENPSEGWQRFPSMVAWAVALWATQRALVPTVNPWLAAAAALTTLAWPESLLHLGENRAYGMLMLFCASAVWVNAKIHLDGETRKLLCFAGAIQGAGILTHPMAAVFGASALGGLWLSGLRKRPFPWRTGVAYGVGWLAVVPWLGSLQGQIEGTLAETVRWAPPPPPELLWSFLKPGWWIGSLTAVLAASAVTGHGKKQIDGKRAANFLMATGGFFLATGITLWAVSQKTNPLFLERYVLPTRIGWACLLAGGVGIIGLAENVQRATGASGCALLLAALVVSTPQPRAVTGGFWSANPWVDAGLADEKFLAEALPVACETSTVYLPRHHYRGRERQYYLILNKEAAEEDGGPAMMDYKMNSAVRKVDPEQKVLPGAEFVTKFARFYLLDETGPSAGDRSFPRERYSWKEISLGEGKEERNIRLFLVEKKRG